MLAVFADAAVLRNVLAFEAALARALAQADIIPAKTASSIVEACAEAAFDPAEMAEAAAHAGTIAIPVVAKLRQALHANPSAAEAVHRGATSQDVADTALMMQVQGAVRLLMRDIDRICNALSARAQQYARTPALGRTLLRGAQPITVGLRIAQWLAGIADARARLADEYDRSVRLQFGGAVGTYRGLDGRGAAVAAAIAEMLGLPLAPGGAWHARRNAIAGLASALSIVIGAIGKMARDISLLAQDEIGEMFEPLVEGRGGSSAMPGKRNSTSCQVALSAAHRAPGLATAIYAAMPQDLERGLGGWQAEGPPLIDLFLLAGGAAASMADVAGGLEIDEAAIARNLAKAPLNGDIAEAERLVAELLSAHAGPR